MTPTAYIENYLTKTKHGLQVQKKKITTIKHAQSGINKGRLSDINQKGGVWLNVFAFYRNPM